MLIETQICEAFDHLHYTPDAFKGRYRVQLHELLSLSDEEITQACPGKNALHCYNTLIAIVSEASRKNQSPAILADVIRSVGDGEVRIAKLVAGLASIFR